MPCLQSEKIHKPGLCFLLILMMSFLAVDALFVCAEGMPVKKMKILDPVLQHQSSNPNETDLPHLSGPPAFPLIQTCHKLLDAIRSGADLGESVERPSFAYYAPCLAVTVIHSGRDATVSRFRLNRLGRQIYEYLDLATVPSSLAPRRPSSNYQFSSFRFEFKRFNPLSLELRNSDFVYSIKVLAIGDFTNDTSEDLLVQFSDRARRGTYDSLSILVLSWLQGRSKIEAMNAIDVIRMATLWREPQTTQRHR